MTISVISFYKMPHLIVKRRRGICLIKPLTLEHMHQDQTAHASNPFNVFLVLAKSYYSQTITLTLLLYLGFT